MTDEIKRYDHLLQRKWYIQGFHAVPLLINHGGESATKDTWQAVGYGYEAIMNAYENDYCEMYYDVASLERIYQEFMKQYHQDKTYLQKLLAQSRKEVKEVYRFIETLRKLYFSSLKTEELLEHMRKANNRYAHVLATSHIIEGFSLNSDKEIKELLLAHLKALGKEKEFSHLLTELTMPTEQSVMAMADEHLLQLSCDVHNTPGLQSLFEKEIEAILKERQQFPAFFQKLEKHAQEYYWIQANYAQAPFADHSYFINEIKQILKEKKRLPKKDFLQKEKKEELLKELGISGKLRELLELTNCFMLWQDTRKKDMLSICCYVDLLAKHVAERFGLEQTLVRYLISHEFTQENLSQLTNKMLHERRRGCIVIYTKQERTVLSGSAYQEIKTKLKKHEPTTTVKEIAGMCASVGKAVGTARICKTIHDIQQFTKGEVLVASMTRPEFVPAMKKASAIVTDEGGITSHAAIISRELRIPCVIGTKIATKVIKNGDLIEVKANHGMVVILT